MTKTSLLFSCESLGEGTATEDFEDFTGGIVERYELNKAPPNLIIILTLSPGSLLSTAVSVKAFTTHDRDILSLDLTSAVFHVCLKKDFF